MDFLAPLLLGLALGALIGWLLARQRPALPDGTREVELATARSDVARFKAELDMTSTERDRLRNGLEQARIELASVHERSRQQAERQQELVAEVQSQGTQLAATAAERDGLREQAAAADATRRAQQDALAAHLSRSTEAEARATTAEQARSALEARTAVLTQELASLRSAHDERIKELHAAREQLVTTFKATAAQVLKDTKDQQVQEQRERLDATLKPFQEQLKGFQDLVSKTYSEEDRQRSSLKKEIELLASRHQTLAKEAERLTNALVGNSKVRGDWGELTLRRILEQSGLREGHEFRLQESTTLADGSRLRPDVVISLPDDAALIIDAKVQLISWQKLTDATTPEELTAAKSALVTAIRSHMRGLDRKAYSDLYAQAVDTVILYIPIDAALLAALAADQNLYDEAFQRGVVLTGPTMLMALLRSVAQQWRGRQHSDHVLRIAKLAEDLGKKLTSFLDSFEQVGQRLAQADEAFGRARNQLSTGNGNVIKRAVDLGALGIKACQKIGANWTAVDLDTPGPAPALDLAEDHAVDETIP